MIFVFLARTFFVPVFAEELQSGSPETENKFGQIFNGWGDRIFSFFGDAIDNERKERQDLLEKLAGPDGELTNSEIQTFLRNEAEVNAEEERRAIEQLGKMYDPNDGMFSGLYKHKKKLEEERQIQANVLDEKINRLISEIDEVGVKTTILKLRTIHWIPIGHSTIDEEMTTRYASLIETLIEDLKPQ